MGRVDGEFTGEAKALWDKIPPAIQDELLANVWCSNCLNTRIVRFKGTVDRGELVLRGYCARCGKRVARVID